MSHDPIPLYYAVRIGEWTPSPSKRWKQVLAATPGRAVELVLRHHDRAVRRLARRRIITRFKPMNCHLNHPA
jgi:hypothetical protein